MAAHGPRRPRTRTPRSAPNPSGLHLLHCPSVIGAVVHSAEVRAYDRVLDLGAGPGALTAALARTGAHVTAVERDAAFVEELRRRFEGRDRVHVVHADLRTARLPRNVKIVANIPFATSGELISRMLDPPGRPRAGADLIVQRGFAQRLSTRWPRSAHSAWWSARYEIRLVQVVPRSSFEPPPRVDAAHLRIRAREPLTPDAERRLRALLHAAYGTPTARSATIARRLAGRTAGRRFLQAAGADPDGPAAHVTPQAWAHVARRDL